METERKMLNISAKLNHTSMSVEEVSKYHLTGMLVQSGRGSEKHNLPVT